MDFSLVGLWSQMGMVAKGVVIILLLMSMVSIGITVERFLTFRRGRSQSIGYIGALQPLMATPGRLREAVGLEQRWRGSPVARVIGTGVNEFVRGMDALGPRAQDPAEIELVVDGVSRSMERVKDRELANLRRGLPFLATVSSSAPFVGLFGTVFGIITAFQNMADPNKGGGGLASVSAGIAEALLTTAVGLAVAIVSVWFYNFFTTKVDDFTIDVDETAGEVLDGMNREGRGPAAAAAMGRPMTNPQQPQRW
jgi:biopolymer transport protein ExbB/TolQ